MLSAETDRRVLPQSVALDSIRASPLLLSGALQILLAVFSGVLGWLSFPTYSLTPLIFIALVPLLVAASAPRTSLRTGFTLGWLTGAVGYVGAFPWVLPTIARFQDVSLTAAFVPFLLFVAYHALQIGIFGALATATTSTQHSRLNTQNSITWVLWLASLWVALEWLFPKIFPWSFATVLADHLALIQIVELTGVWGLSFVILVVNASLASAVITWQQRRRVTWAPLAFAALLVAAVWSYGVVRLAELDHDPSPQPSATSDVGEGARVVLTVATVQGNISPGPSDATTEDQSLSIYRQLTLPLRDAPVDLVIWPESTVRMVLPQHPHFRERIFDVAATLQRPLLVGSMDARADGQATFNSLFAVAPTRAFTAVYHKTRLLPFGESAPLLGAVWRTTGYFAPGAAPSLLTVGTHHLAPSICYEALFPGFFNDLVRHGASVLVNVTDDSWFGHGHAPWQHLQGAIFRAVETRRPLVRASNSGISAIIAPSGRIAAHTELFARTVMRGSITPTNGQTLYVRWGDWFALACVLMVLGLALPRRAG